MKLSLQIDWSEVDAFGHVNNVAYFKYIQTARVQLCDACGLNSLPQKGSLSFMVAASQCQFKKSLHYPGIIHLESKVTQVNVTSFEITHFIYNAETICVAFAKDVLVVFDYNLREKVKVTEAMRTALLTI